jgi:N-acetyl-alpha-D-muramate 1-phosphate uridylyltransferase
MDAMILAAGLGTRLRPLTDTLPKALVPVGGVPMLERVARRLVAAGADRLIVNVHHHADQVRRFIRERGGFGVEVLVSDEPDVPLETGGGVLHARDLFRADAPFLLHNVDVISEIDLAAMLDRHRTSGALVTLAVSDRPSDRLLRFDRLGLQARVDRGRRTVEAARAASGSVVDLAFAGVHVVAPGFLEQVTERGAFSIMAPYLRLAGAAQSILPYHIGDALWLEMGDPERLARARRLLDPADS